MTGMSGRVLVMVVATFVAASCADDSSEVPVEGATAAVISGVADSNNAHGAVAQLGQVLCSAVVVARRVALTSAHCLPFFATNCGPYTSGSLQVRFAEPNGTVNGANVAARTINVQSIAVHPHASTVDVSQCMMGNACAMNTLDCAEFLPNFCTNPEAPASVNRSRELVVLFLANDVPSDVTPKQILVHPAFEHISDRFVSFADLEAWAQANTPLVTIVGFGLGSQTYATSQGLLPVATWACCAGAE